MAEENGKVGFQFSGKISIKDIVLLLGLLGVGANSQYNRWSIEQKLASCEARVLQLERRLEGLYPKHHDPPGRSEPKTEVGQK